jgi:hypothetical protein
MFRNVFLVDITEHRGPDERAINSVRAQASECNAELVDWFELPHQAQPQLPITGRVFPGLETGLQLWPKIQQRIFELSTNGYKGAIFHVLSYSPYILSEARKLSGPEIAIRTTPVPVLLTKWRTSLGSSSTRSYPANQVLHYGTPPALSLHEALELTKRVLRKYGHISKQTALLQVQLRPLLAREDQRAKKNALDRRSSRLISNVVAEGLRTCCIGLYNIENIPGTERVWLIGDRPTDKQAPILLPGEHLSALVPQAFSPTALAPALEVSQSLPRTSEGSTSADISPTAQTVPKDTDSIGSAASTSEETQAKQTDKRSTDKGRKRTAEIVKALKNAGVYSPNPQRDHLFKALRSCLPQGSQPRTLLQLTREIRRAATESASAIEKFPFWHPATEGMVCMLMGAGVLLNEAGHPIASGPFARGSQVASFDEPLEDRCEAFLLETAITSMKDVTKRDRMALAHALFWDSTQNDLDRVEDRFEHIFNMLADRLVETTEGIWSVEPHVQREKARAAVPR